MPSDILSLINESLQTQRDERARRWELEDRQLELRQKMLFSRREEACDHVNHYFEVSTLRLNRETPLVYTKNIAEHLTAVKAIGQVSNSQAANSVFWE